MKTLTVDLRPEDDADNWFEENYILDKSGELEHEDKPSTKMGNVGENLIRKHLVEQGYVCTTGWTPGREPADIICQKAPNIHHLFAIEVKTKDPWDNGYGLEFGINVNQYITYRGLKIPLKLYFVSARRQTVYMIEFKKLETLKPREDDWNDGKKGYFFTIDNFEISAVIDPTVVKCINKWSDLNRSRNKKKEEEKLPLQNSELYKLL